MKILVALSVPLFVLSALIPIPLYAMLATLFLEATVLAFVMAGIAQDTRRNHPAVAAHCTPSRGSVLTGYQPNQQQVWTPETSVSASLRSTKRAHEAGWNVRLPGEPDPVVEGEANDGQANEEQLIWIMPERFEYLELGR